MDHGSSRTTLPVPGGPGGPAPAPRRSAALVAAALGLVVLIVAALAAGLFASHQRRAHRASTASTAPAAGQQPGSAAALGKAVFGVYSAGFKESDCYGACKPGDAGYANQQADRSRMAELQALKVRFVINNDSPLAWLQASAPSFFRFMDDLHAHGVGASYAVASTKRFWLSDKTSRGPAGAFTTAIADKAFAATDLDHNGVSDLDGHIDALFEAHEVLEWATHDQRVQMYRLSKKWLPHTPVSVYYAGVITRPVDNPAAKHFGKNAGTWGQYAYGPGEADIVHIAPGGATKGDKFNFTALAQILRADVAVVRKATPDVPVWVSTSFAGDNQMNADPSSMWTPEQLLGWYRAVAGVPGIKGVFLRSFGRFTYDLGNPRFTAQRQEAAKIGAAAQAGTIP